jgi:hypothetical protein
MSFDKSLIYQKLDELIDEYNKQKEKQGSPIRVEKRNGKYYFVIKNIVNWATGDIAKTGIKPEVTVTDEVMTITFKFEDIIEAIKKSVAGINMDSFIGGYVVESVRDKEGNKDYNLVIPINL